MVRVGLINHFACKNVISFNAESVQKPVDAID